MLVSRIKEGFEAVEFRPVDQKMHYSEYVYRAPGPSRIIIALSILRKGMWYILMPSVVFLIISLLFMSRQEPRYSASATVMFEVQRANITNFQELLTPPEFNRVALENAILVLRSSSLLKRVADELGLQNDPRFNPDIRSPDEDGGDGEAAFGVGSIISGISHFLAGVGIGNSGEAPPVPEEEARVRELATIDRLREELVLRPVTAATIIEISYTSHSAELSAAIVNEVAEQYIVDQLQTRIDITDAANRWLSDRVDELREKVQESEEAIENLRTQSSETAGQSLSISEQQLAVLNSVLSLTRSELATAEARYVGLRDAMETGQDLGFESAIIQDYREEERDLLARLEALSDSHPEVIGITRQLEVLRSRIEAEARRVVASAEVDFQALETQVGQLQNSIQELELKISSQARDEVRIRQMEQEAEANRLFYENILARLNQTSEQEELQDAGVRILSAAPVPLEPLPSHRLRNAFLAMVFGASLGAGYIFAREYLNNTFRSPAQFEGLASVPVLAMLPRFRRRVRKHKLVEYLVSRPTSALAEAVRNLRTSILLGKVREDGNVIMFTSTVPNEGKSTTSILTAISSRQMGRSTILVDCDFRLSTLEQYFGEERGQPGILSVLEGSSALEDAIYTEPATGLHVLMVRKSDENSGRNAADVISSIGFSELIRYLSKLYDVVILDTPPSLIVTDARIISSVVNTVIYVVRWNRTARDAVLEGLGELETVGAPVKGAVFSMVGEAASSFIHDGYRSYRGSNSSYYKN